MKFWASSEISGWGAKFCVEVANFVSVVKFWVGGGNILEIGQFKAKNYLIGGVGGGGVVVVGGGLVNNSGTLLGSKFQSATNSS